MEPKSLRQNILELPYCTKEIKILLAQQFYQLTLQKGQIPIGPNIIDRTLYFVEQGLLRSYSKAGTTPVTHMIHLPGDYLIQEGTYLQEPTKTYVECLTDTSLANISFQQLEKFIQQYPEGIKILLSILDIRNSRNLQHHLLLRTQPADERYLQASLLLGSHIQNIPKEVLASYLNLSRKHLSRLALANLHRQ